jgi:hypothetical protein
VNSPNKLPDGRGRPVPAVEVEFTKGPDGKLRYFRFTIGVMTMASFLVVLCVLTQGPNDKWLGLLKWIAAFR